MPAVVTHSRRNKGLKPLVPHEIVAVKSGVQAIGQQTLSPLPHSDLRSGCWVVVGGVERLEHHWAGCNWWITSRSSRA